MTRRDGLPRHWPRQGELVSSVLRHRLTWQSPVGRPTVVAAAAEGGVHLRLVDPDHVGISVGEDATDGDLAAVASGIRGGAAPPSPGWATWPGTNGRPTT